MPALKRLLLTALFASLAAGTLAACDSSADPASTAGTPDAAIGDVAAGKAAIARVGCGSCHVIPGIAGAVGMVGPPLDHIGSRQFLAGMLHNTPESMVAWLRFPQHVVPGNAMPDMGLSAAEARNIAAYLETLK
jgi:cytochrome c2